VFYCCSSTFPCCALLLLINISLLCYVDVHRHLLIVFCCCSPAFSCYVLLVVINIFLLCSIGACQCLLGMSHWCLSMPPCYVILVLVNVFFLCFVSAHWHLFMFLLMFVDVSLVGFYWCSLTPFIVLCWCSSRLSCCVLLVFVDIYLLHLLTHQCFKYFSNPCCSSSLPCYDLLLFVNASFLCSIDVRGFPNCYFPCTFLYMCVGVKFPNFFAITQFFQVFLTTRFFFF